MKKKSLWFVLSGTILSSFGFVPAYLNENVENSIFTSEDDVLLSGKHIDYSPFFTKYQNVIEEAEKNSRLGCRFIGICM